MLSPIEKIIGVGAHKYNFEDFQKSEMFMDTTKEGDFTTEIVGTVVNGVLIFLKAETKRI